MKVVCLLALLFFGCIPSADQERLKELDGQLARAREELGQLQKAEAEMARLKLESDRLEGQTKTSRTATPAPSRH